MSRVMLRGAWSRPDRVDYTPMSDEDARLAFEWFRWPRGPICPRCGFKGSRTGAYAIKRNQMAKVRPGLWSCRACDKQFTATVGTIFEDSHIPLSVWMAMIAGFAQGESALTLSRRYGVSYKSVFRALTVLRGAILTAKGKQEAEPWQKAKAAHRNVKDMLAKPSRSDSPSRASTPRRTSAMS